MPPTRLYRACSGLEVSPGLLPMRLLPAPSRRFATSSGCLAPLTKSQHPADNFDAAIENGSSKLPAAAHSSARSSRAIARRTVRHSPPMSRLSGQTYTTWFPDGRNVRDFRTFSTRAHKKSTVLDVMLEDELPQPLGPDEPLQRSPPQESPSSRTSATIRQPRSDGRFLDRLSARSQPSEDRPSTRDVGTRIRDKRRAKTKEEREKQWKQIRRQYTKEELPQVIEARRMWYKNWTEVTVPLKKLREARFWQDEGEWMFKLEGVPAMRKAWATLDAEQRKQQWPTMMLSTLHFCPDRASMVLEATLDDLPPGYAIHDVLLFCAKYLHLANFRTARERAVKADEILELVSKVIETLPPRHVPIGQRTFGILARKLPSSQVKELYDIMVRAGVKLHANTQLHFASKLAGKLDHKGTAFTILKALTEGSIDLNGPNVASVITTLLHCKGTDDALPQTSDVFSPKDALQYFMEKGLVPNVIGLTAILSSLCRRGEVDEATRLALLFSESGVQLDAKACVTIFNGAKISRKAENVTMALDVAKASNMPYVDVLNNMLHTAFYFAEADTRERRREPPWVLPLFIPLLHIYAKKFDLAPLQAWLPDTLPLLLVKDDMEAGVVPDKKEAVAKFGPRQSMSWDSLQSILPVAKDFFSRDVGPRLQPSSTTLATMLRAYIKSLQNSYDIVAFYRHFKSRLEEQVGADSFTQLVEDQGTIIHDTFIMAMLERKGLQREALQVFGDMLKSRLRQTRRPDGSWRSKQKMDEDTTVHPTPNLFTFTILLRGLVAQKESVLVDQILQVLREHRIQPNIVTMNTLIKGYASMQNINQTVESLQSLEEAGFKPDMFTFEAFGRLKDQDKAFKIMENIIDVNARRMFEEQDE